MTPIKFDIKTKKLVDKITMSIKQAESKLILVCEVYLNVKGKSYEKQNWELLPDNSGLIEVEKDNPKGKDST